MCLASHPPQSPNCPAQQFSGPSPATNHGKTSSQCCVGLSWCRTTRRKGIRTVQAAAQSAKTNAASSKTNHGVQGTNCARLCEHASARRDCGWHRCVALHIFVAFGLFAGIADPDGHSEGRAGACSTWWRQIVVLFRPMPLETHTRQYSCVCTGEFTLPWQGAPSLSYAEAVESPGSPRARHVSRVVSLYQRGT
jgi:hypothetical protein